MHNRSKSDGSVEDSGNMRTIPKARRSLFPPKLPARKWDGNRKNLKELDGFCRYITKENQINSIKERREKELDPKYLESKFKVNRWRDFKERRLDVIRDYIGTKRKLRQTKLFVMSVKMTQIILKLAEGFHFVKEERKVRYWKLFVGIRLMIKFRQKWKLYYGAAGLENVHRNRIRHALMLYHSFCNSSNDAIIGLSAKKRASSMKQLIRHEQKAIRDRMNNANSILSAIPQLQRKSSMMLSKLLIKEKSAKPRISKYRLRMMDPYTMFFNFLEDRAVERNTIVLIDKLRRAYRSVLFVQRRFKSVLEVRESRIGVIMLLWDRILLRIYKTVSQRQTNQAQKISDVVTRIMSIDPHVKREVVTAYIQRCEANYTIAFS